MPLVMWRMTIAGECTNEQVVLHEKVGIGSRIRLVWISSAVQYEWTHLGLGSALEYGRETLLHHGAKVLTILTLGLPVPVLVMMPGRTAAMEEWGEEW